MKKASARKAEAINFIQLSNTAVSQGISFPLIFRILLLLIYALNIIPNGNFDTGFLLIILFIKIFVAEKVAKSLAK